MARRIDMPHVGLEELVHLNAIIGRIRHLSIIQPDINGRLWLGCYQNTLYLHRPLNTTTDVLDDHITTWATHEGANRRLC